MTSNGDLWSGAPRTSYPILPSCCHKSYWCSGLGHHRFKQWLVACSAPSHCLNKCIFIGNWTLWTTAKDFSIKMQKDSSKKMHLKISSPKCQPIYSGLGWFLKAIYINSLCDAKWRHRSESSLAQIMACCQTTPIHHLSHTVDWSCNWLIRLLCHTHSTPVFLNVKKVNSDIIHLGISNLGYGKSFLNINRYIAIFGVHEWIIIHQRLLQF